MNKGKQLSINFITQILSFIINLVISFCLTPYVIKCIGKEVYGYVSLANNFTSYVSVFTVALNGMLSRYVTIFYAKKDYDSVSRYMSSVLLTNVGIMLVLLPTSISFVANLGKFIKLPVGVEGDIKLLFLLIFVSFCINLPGGCFYSCAYAANRLDKANISSLISSILRITVLMVMLTVLTPHVWYAGFASLICTVYLIVAYCYYQRKYMPEISIAFRYFDWTIVKELMGIGIWNSISQLSQLLLIGLDLIIANVMVSVISMNLLSYAKMIPSQLVSLLAAIAGIFAPMMTIAYGKGDKDEFICETKFAIKCSGFLCSVPIIGLVVFGENFFRLWLKALSMDEIHIVAILSILTILPQIFSVYIYPLYTVNMITTKIKIPVIVTIGYGILNIFLVYLLLQVTDLGIYAVAGVSSVLSVLYILIFVPNYAAYTISAARLTFYKPLILGILCNGILLCIFCIIHNILPIKGWKTFFGACGIAATIGYILTFFILFNRMERKEILRFVMRRIRNRI